jgi:predicted nucleic acid-binding protein
MILVDSSALIDYYRPAGLPRVRSAVAEVIEADLVAINGVIQVEVLSFADVISYRKLRSDFKIFHWLDLHETEFDLATEMGFSLRRKAITIPATDLIIAASAIQAGAVLYHVDSHYDTISQHCNLKSRNLGAGLPL